jgi:hypothetical protein
MKEQVVIIGEFENKLYAEIAKRDLKTAGISADILKDCDGVFFSLLYQAEGVLLIVPDTKVEEAKKILQTKFI